MIIYIEFPYIGQQAIRINQWKIRKNLFKNKKIKLYNLDTDKLEINDLSDKYPDIEIKWKNI